MTYKDFILNKEEIEEQELHKELAECFNGVFQSETSIEEQIKYGHQYEVIEGIYMTIVRLLQIDNIDISTDGNTFYFSVVHSESNNQLLESNSPKLSRKRLLDLKIYELSDILIEMFLDRDNWSQEKGISYKLSDGNGNWII